MGYAFISYKREEQSKADALRNIFINNGIDCWMDVYNIPAGKIWGREINNAIESDSCSCFVLVLTELSQSSENILDEIAAAKDANKPIIPVRFGSFKLNSDMRFYLRRWQIEDVKSFDETDAGIRKVIEAVKNLAGVKESEKRQAEKEEASDIVTVVDKNGSKYIGQMKNGKKHGKGTLYRPDGSKIYEGDWIDGKVNGKGTMFNSDGSILYDGDWVDGKWHGKGTSYRPDGSKWYDGDWVNGKWQGKGTGYNSDGSKCYEGDFVNGKMQGKGTWYNSDGSKAYEGDFINGKMCGKGTFYYGDGERYEGNWVDSLPHGEGTYYWGNGDIYIGKWKNNKRSGWGTFFYADGRTEEHYYENDELKETK